MGKKWRANSEPTKAQKNLTLSILGVGLALLGYIVSGLYPILKDQALAQKIDAGCASECYLTAAELGGVYFWLLIAAIVYSGVIIVLVRKKYLT